MNLACPERVFGVAERLVGVVSPMPTPNKPDAHRAYEVAVFEGTETIRLCYKDRGLFSTKPDAVAALRVPSKSGTWVARGEVGTARTVREAGS